MIDVIRKQKDTHLHRIMGKGYEQVIQKEKMVMAFKNYEIPPIKLSSIKNKLQYPMLSHIWGSEQLHILLVGKLLEPFHKLIVSLLWKTFLRILIFFKIVNPLWRIVTKINMDIFKDLTLNIFIVNIWLNICKI